MAALDFPNSPTPGQTFVAGAATWTWDGTKWEPTGGSGVSSFNTRTGAVTLTSGDVTTALTFTPYNSTNPAGYQTAAQVTAALPAASSTTPAMDGAAAVGTGTTWARNDHVHPVDTSRYAAANPSGYQTAAQVSASISAAAYTLPVATTTVLGGVKVDGTSVTISSGVISSTAGASPSNAAPAMDGVAAAGALATYARGDHVHPSDTSRYAATNPSGYQTAAQVTAALPVASSTTPAMDGTAAVGTGTTWARADHVHPVDTSRYAATNPSGYQTAAQVSSAITAAAYTLPTASTTVLGGVKVDGTTVTIASGVISAAGGGGGISDAPNDGTSYARKSAAWAHLTHSDLTDWATATASFSYTLPNATTTVLGGVKVDGTTITAASGVISAVQPTVPGPSGTTPVMDGTATAGSSALYSRGDHVHPTDTTRAAVSALPVVATTVPLIDGTATIGASGKWADGAHIHPTDTSRAPVASPTFTGTVTIPTGAAIATPNISGVTTASNAAAGQVGEWITASQLTAQSLTSATALNLSSISLTAGDWDVDGDVFYQASGLVVSNFVCGVNLTSLAIPAVGTPGRAQMVGAANAFVQSSFSTGRLRVNVSTTTTVYLVVSATFGSGTCTAQGTIQARRMR